MDEQPRKGPGRPRKAISATEVGGQIGSDASHEPGDGPIGEGRIETSADAEGSSQTNFGLVSFDELVSIAHAEDGHVVRIWHPEAKVHLIHAKNGSGIEVKQGKAAYQLTTGEVIEV